MPPPDLHFRVLRVFRGQPIREIGAFRGHQPAFVGFVTFVVATQPQSNTTVLWP